MSKLKAKRIQSILYYYIMNGVFGVCTYFGFYQNVDGAKNIALFMGWFLGVIGLLFFLVFMIEDVKKAVAKELYKQDWKPSAPYVLDLAFDLAILGTFVWFGHYVLAFFYMFNISAAKTLRTLQKSYTFEMLVADRKEGKA